MLVSTVYKEGSWDLGWAVTVAAIVPCRIGRAASALVSQRQQGAPRRGVKTFRQNQDQLYF